MNTYELLRQMRRGAPLDAAGLLTSMPQLQKAWTQPGSAISGIQGYDLEAGAKMLLPVLTPLRNMIAREVGGFGIQANWRAVTGINTGNLRIGLSEGNRGGIMAQTTADYLAAFKTCGLDNNVTYQADMAAKGFEDLKGLAVQQLLQALMIREEIVDLGGNTSVALGTTPTPTLSASASGGTIGASKTVSVICVALGPEAFLDVYGTNNGATGQVFAPTTTNVPGVISRTNADGSTDTFGGGSAQQSANATQAVSSGTTNSVLASVAVVPGAWGYAWYVGDNASPGTEKLFGISSINSIVITSIPGSGQLASALAISDNSTNAYEYDGLFAQAIKGGSGAYVNAQATGTVGTGTPLTSDSAGGISEFEAAFASMYNKYRLSPTHIFVSSQEMINITKKIIGNSGAPLIRFNANAQDLADGKISAGVVVGDYLNKVMGTRMPMMVHPNLPPGTVLFHTHTLPYPLNNVGATIKKRLRRDYFQLEWAPRSLKYEYGCYFDGVLQNYAPFATGILQNIGNG